MRPLVVLVALVLLIGFYLYERAHRFVIIPAGESRAFVLDQQTGEAWILTGIAKMRVTDFQQQPEKTLPASDK